MEAFGRIQPVVRADVCAVLRQRHEARGLDPSTAADVAALQASYLAGDPWQELLERAGADIRARVEPYVESIEPWAHQVLSKEDQMREVVLYQLRVRSLLEFNQWVREGREEAFYESDQHQRVSEILSALGGEPEEPPDPEEFQSLVVAFHRRTQMRIVPNKEQR